MVHKQFTISTKSSANSWKTIYKPPTIVFYFLSNYMVGWPMTRICAENERVTGKQARNYPVKREMDQRHAPDMDKIYCIVSRPLGWVKYATI